MIRFLFTILFCLRFIQTEPSVSVDDFKSVLGNWKGTLTYLDYSSGKPYTMPANVSISIDTKNNDQVIFSYQYPNEPKANSSDTLQIKSNGTMFYQATVTLKKINAYRSVQIETEITGIDGNDNKQAILKHVYLMSSKQFINRKEVKFMGEQNWITRNEYNFSR